LNKPGRVKLRLFGLAKKDAAAWASRSWKPCLKPEFSRMCTRVTGGSCLDNLWEGLPDVAIKELVKILPEARFAIIHAWGDSPPTSP
jgi:hypothetical protein